MAEWRSDGGVMAAVADGGWRLTFGCLSVVRRWDRRCLAHSGDDVGGLC